MSDIDQAREASRDVYASGQTQHEAKWTHELLGGAAAFEGVKLWEDHQRSQGKPVSHSFAKEALAGIVGATVDRLVETKGLDKLDEEKARRHAHKTAENIYDNHYGGHDQYDPNKRERPNFDGN
ncbi:hypothetical protein DV736_g2774, partial [Chaetothyriales sp. CBS 134916]